MIRAAQSGDAAAIADLWNWMIRDTLATFTTEEKSCQSLVAMIADRPNAFFVAEVDAAVQGFVTFGPFRSGPGYAATREHSIVVSPDAHGRGLGLALMEHAMNAAQKQGIHVMVGAISGANPAAMAFHEKIGFSVCAKMPEVGRKSDQWLDLVLMQKILPPVE